jgi:hypothetical protein
MRAELAVALVIAAVACGRCGSSPPLSDAGAAALEACRVELATCVREAACCHDCDPVCERTPGQHDRICLDPDDTCARDRTCVSSYQPCVACIANGCTPDTAVTDAIGRCTARYDKCAAEAFSLSDPDGGYDAVARDAAADVAAEGDADLT